MNKLIKNQGFTLIEVMVALFILTIGMLGSTSMMLRTQQQAEESNIETAAGQRAWNIAELLRASINSVNADAYDDMTIVPGVNEPACLTTGCAEADMDDVTRFFISKELETFLPNENAEVKITDITGSVGTSDVIFKVVVTWDKLTPTGAIPVTYEMIFQP